MEPDYKLGNIHELPIIELANSARQQAFGDAKETTLPRYCLDCEVRFACNGECPKNRFIQKAPDGEARTQLFVRRVSGFLQSHRSGHATHGDTNYKPGRPATGVMAQLKSERQQQPITCEKTSDENSLPGRRDEMTPVPAALDANSKSPLRGEVIADSVRQVVESIENCCKFSGEKSASK